MPRLFKINIILVSISLEAEILLKFLWKTTLEFLFYFVFIIATVSCSDNFFS